MTRLKKLLSLSLVACSLCFALTGCGNDTNGSTSGNNDNTMGNAADDLGHAVDDVADGVGNAVDDLVGNNGFDNYDDAHKYFMDTMGSYHSESQFEVRDENRNLTDYQEGSKGYQFHLYDTANNKDGELFGEFYVDADTGMIYQAGENNQFTEYRGAGSSINEKNNTENNADGIKTGGNGSTTGTDMGAANGNGGNSTGGNSTGGNASSGAVGGAGAGR